MKKRNIPNSVFVFALVFFFTAASFSASPRGDEKGIVAWWTFDETEDKLVKDIAKGIQDKINGNFRYVQGSTGKAIKFDGFTTSVTRKASEAPQLSDGFTIEAWVAVAAYPWNWCPIVSQQKVKEAGYAFEIGPRGEFGLKLFSGGKWQECLSEAKIPLKKWVHIAGVYDEAKGITLFLNGKEAGKLPFNGRLELAESTDLLIGMNHKKLKPAFIHREHGTLPAWYSFDGIIDEVKIHNRAVSSEKTKEIYATQKPSFPPDIPPRIMPSGPQGPGRFGAYYTKLKYYWEWDAYWRVGDHPDVVVQFDDSLIRVVFWRGTRYSPAWITENGLWMADQSVEAWDDEEGCFEHMQDHHCRYSHVRIIENTDARVVVHWRYAPVSSYNHLWRQDEKTGWACWVDEYYYFYPDHTGIRKATWRRGSLGRPRQFQESIPLTHPGQLQGDVINADYVTIANLNGETQVFSYVKNPPRKNTKSVPENPTIQMHNLKSKAKPFIIFEKGDRMHYLKDMNIASLSRPGSCSHWPVGQVPSDGRTTQAPDRASSFLGFPISDPPIHEGPNLTNWVNSLYGMTEKPIEELVILARSWAQAPELVVQSKNIENEGYDLSQRAYILKCKQENNLSELKCKLMASTETPVVNVCLYIKGWGDRDVALVMESEPLAHGRDYRLGHVHTLEGSDLIVWINRKYMHPVEISLVSE
jgi:hypothetical protein